jgi:hypothetical protein
VGGPVLAFETPKEQIRLLWELRGESGGIPHLPKSGRYGAPGDSGGARVKKRVPFTLHLPPASEFAQKRPGPATQQREWDDRVLLSIAY